jgi:hypothetical protein
MSCREPVWRARTGDADGVGVAGSTVASDVAMRALELLQALPSLVVRAASALRARPSPPRSSARRCNAAPLQCDS